MRHLLAGIVLIFSIGHSHATEPTTLPNQLENLRACERHMNTSASTGVGCLVGHGLVAALARNKDIFDRAGKQVFGENFQFVSQLHWSSATPITASIGGDIDVVIPVSGADGIIVPGRKASLFFQQGMTRWWDNTGAVRHDMRHGFARRFRVSEHRKADIFGIYGFLLHNLEHRHELVAFGADYAGRWGTGALRYFLPISGWRPARPGYEERALEGMELNLALDLTTTAKIFLAGYRWREEESRRRWTAGARLGVDWKPHPWVGFSARYEGIGRSGRSVSLYAGINIPIGASGKPPRWKGLGLAAAGTPPDAAALWRPIDEVGRIRIETRAETQSSGTVSNGLNVRFLYERVGSGEDVQVEVSLRDAASEDVSVIVRLVPGDGENPAVAGVDFADEPVEATIARGSRRVVVSISLLRNEGMTEGRSLGVTASVAS